MKNKFLYILVIVFLIFGAVYINHTSFAGIQDVVGSSSDETNQLLFNKVATLQGYAESYKQEKGSSTSVGQLCMQFIRREKYATGAWKYMLGDIESGFVDYVLSKDSKFNITSADKLIDKTSGNEIDFIHMIATLNAYVKPNMLVDKSYAGWAGDLMTLLGEVVKYRINNNVTDNNVLQNYTNSLLGTGVNGSFNRADALADLDAINLSLYSNINTNLYQALVDYYITLTDNNSSYSRYETAKSQLGNTKDAIRNDAKNKISNSLLQSLLLPDDVRGKATSSDIEILANSFVDYVYQEPYIEYSPNMMSIFVGVNEDLDIRGRNLDNLVLDYDKNHLFISKNNNKFTIKGLKYGTSDISLYNKENVLITIIRVNVKNIAPSISSNLDPNISLRIGVNNIIRFTVGGTNNVYNWYILDSKTDEGTLFKTTNSSELAITANNFDLNNKYIRCSITNEGNDTIYTIIAKLIVKDVVPSIKTNLPSSASIEVGTSKTISFTAGGTNNVYNWYLSSSPSKKGTLYKTTYKPEITISPTDFELTGKYLICGISNTGNDEIFTSAIGLNITDTKASITSDLPSSVNITIGSRSTLSFVATGTNNTYNWYIADNSYSSGKLYKSTVESQLAITPSNFDLNGKYIYCEIRNVGNNSIYTKPTKIILKDIAPSIFSDLPSNANLVTNKESTISFSAGGTNNKYTWYLSNNSTDRGNVYKTTTTPDLKLTATKDLNGKYLSCEISNTGNSKIYTKSLKLNVSDKLSVINIDLPESTNMILGTNTLLSFSVNVKATKYVWYISNTSTNKGSVYKTTTKPEISINPVSDFNGKYLRCGIFTEDNTEYFTTSVKLNVKLEPPVIKTDLPTSAELTLNLRKTFSFKVTGVQNKYNWYLTDNPKNTGTLLEITTSPKITITPTIDIHNKYLVCVISNSEENVVKTNYVKLTLKTENNKPVLPDDDEIIDEEENDKPNDNEVISTGGDDLNNNRVQKKEIPSYVYFIIEFVIFIIILKVILSALDNVDNKEKHTKEDNNKTEEK